MADVLSQLPIIRSNRKTAVVVTMVLIFTMCVSVTAWGLIAFHGNVGRLLSGKGGISIIIWDVASAWIAIATLRRKARLVIDDEGVHVTTNNDTRNYLWNDIGRIRHVVTNARSGSTTVQIVRKGQLSMDKQSDLIWGEFGLSEDELTAIIKAGIAKWGSPDAQVKDGVSTSSL